MAKRKNDLEKHTYNAEEALNLIISEDYSFGTSSSEDHHLNHHLPMTLLMEIPCHLLQY